ncbi:DUF4303 domain-containing protein [Lysobacter tyrosinilyticus]
MDNQEDIRRATAQAIRQSVATLKAHGPLFGFALGTDDDLRTLFHVSCSVGWVEKSELDYADIGYIFVEWLDSAHDDLFSPISSHLATLADQTYTSDEAWAAARDFRFHALFLALRDCREAGIFDEQTFLTVGSTDPSDHLQSLEMRAVESLNTPNVVRGYAKAMGHSPGPA